MLHNKMLCKANKMLTASLWSLILLKTEKNSFNYSGVSLVADQ